MGDVIAEKYRVESVLGVGGMGVVLAVTHLTLREPYAIKCLTGTKTTNPDAIARFLAEARAAVRIKSEHIVRVSDVGQLPNGLPYMLMEHLRGQDVSEILAGGPLPVAEAVEYVLQACVGIAEAHALGIVHRDLKPSNLFLTQRLDHTPLLKVLDFGISKAVGEPESSPVLTATDAVFGSPAYMSPEQIRSAKNVDVRTDIWSLGVILHEMLAGDLPFKAETVGGLLSAIAADDPDDVRVRRADVDDALAAVIRRCLEKKVANRFQSVSELAVALEPFKGTTSLVSLGRIHRLSNPPSVPPVRASRPSSQPFVVRGSATEMPWTTVAEHPSPASRVPALLAGGAAVTVLALGLFLGVRLIRSPSTPAAGGATTTEIAPHRPAPIDAPVVSPIPPAPMAASVSAPSTSAPVSPSLSAVAPRGVPRTPPAARPRVPSSTATPSGSAPFHDPASTSH